MKRANTMAPDTIARLLDEEESQWLDEQELDSAPSESLQPDPAPKDGLAPTMDGLAPATDGASSTAMFFFWPGTEGNSEDAVDLYENERDKEGAKVLGDMRAVCRRWLTSPLFKDDMSAACGKEIRTFIDELSKDIDFLNSFMATLGPTEAEFRQCFEVLRTIVVKTCKYDNIQSQVQLMMSRYDRESALGETSTPNKRTCVSEPSVATDKTVDK